VEALVAIIDSKRGPIEVLKRDVNTTLAPELVRRRQIMKQKTSFGMTRVWTRADTHCRSITKPHAAVLVQVANTSGDVRGHLLRIENWAKV